MQNGVSSPAIGSKILFAVMVFGLMLAVGEVVLRWTAHEEPGIVFQSLAEQLDKIHLETFKDVIVADLDRFWRLGANQRLPEDTRHIRGIVSNGAGLREDHEIPRKKPAGEVRILFVGDSCTFGFGTLNGESFVEMTERLLEARFPAVRIECINAGVPGYTLMQGWQHLIHTGLAYHPDLIVASFGWNDSKSWTSRSDWQHLEATRKTEPPGVLGRSELCRQLWHRMHWREAPAAVPGRPVARVSPVEYERILRRMAAEARVHGAEFLPMVWPIMANFTHSEADGSVPLTEYQKIVYRLGREEFRFGPEGEPGFVDLIPAVSGALQHHGLLALFMDGVHTWPLANGFIAEAIVEKVNGWVAAVGGEIAD